MASRPPASQLRERRPMWLTQTYACQTVAFAVSGFLPVVTADLTNIKMEKEMQSLHWIEKVTENHREMHHV